jgi:hypothetical protein
MIFGIPKPIIPFDPLRIYKVNKEFICSFRRFITGPHFKVAYIHLSKIWLPQIKDKKKKGRVALNINYGSNCKSTLLDIYESSEGQLPGQRQQPKPVLVLFYGAGWKSGSKSLYSPVASNLSKRGYAVIVPDLTHWPNGNIQDMLNDVNLALKWIFGNVSKFGGDQSNVSILAHGSGAHLCVTAVLKNAIISTHYQQIHSRSNGTELARHLPGSPGLHRLAGIILIGCPFDIQNLIDWEKFKGIEELTCTSRLFRTFLLISFKKRH